MIFDGVIRSHKQRDELIDFIRSMRLPFKFYLQDVFEKRSLEYNAYYWGVVIDRICEYTGETDPDYLHEVLKAKFNFKWTYDRRGRWMARILGTSEMHGPDFELYVTKVCAWAAIELGLYIPFPHEVIHNENKLTKAA
jgi:hypothetical protein